MAIAYAPRKVRALWTGLLVLDKRLGHAARELREPIMTQLRLAWWRDRFAQGAESWPRGEPLLAVLTAWDDERAALRALVDGWEAQAVGEDGGAALEDAREESILAVARLAGVELTPVVRQAAADWGEGAALRSTRLPGALRPLALLDHFAQASDAPPWRILLGALRKGFLGK